MDSSIPTPREVISREEALKRGLVRYFTGKPCKHGHIAERNTKNLVCVECHRLHAIENYRNDPAAVNARLSEYRKTDEAREKRNAYLAEWRDTKREELADYYGTWRNANRDKIKANNQLWKEKHKERLRTDSAYAEKYRAKESKRARAAREKRQVKEAGRPKPDRCEICDSASKKLRFDHCHQSGKFRGWICNGCNVALGHFKDSPKVVRRLLDYLEKHLTT